MTVLSPNNKSWRRGGHLNQKRHVEMTERERANISRCRGTKSGHLCKNPTFRCSDCGNYGCAQEVLDKCSSQGFKNDKCIQCGVVESRIPVMVDELDRIIAEWEKKQLSPVRLY